MRRPNKAYLMALQVILQAKNLGTTSLDLSCFSCDIPDYQLEQLPPELFELSQLTTLILRDNALTSISPKIANLKRLKILDIKGNKLESLPPELFNLIYLQKLDLSYNQINRLGPELQNLQRLIHLDLTGNKLTELPSGIGALTQLENLLLSKNLLKTLPFEITNLKLLKRFDLSNNQDIEIPPEIMSKSIQDILDYIWRANSPETSQPLNEAKLLMVGQGGVGKTSLINCLLRGSYNVNEGPTQGIRIEKSKLMVNKHFIKLNIWDFGGQEIMHATHQFFLTKRSLYLLVIDARQGEQEGRVEYWLSIIKSFADSSPIIVVINKIDQYQLDINRRGLQKKYPNIISFVRTSCKTLDGLLELTQTIQSALTELPHVHNRIPNSWFIVKKHLENLTMDYISYSQYIRLCQKSSVDNGDESRLLRFLHDLGVVLNFQDDIRINDTNILNPEWVTDGVYDMLNSQILSSQFGVLYTSQLKQILNPFRYPVDKHYFIIYMMEKFELCFPFEQYSAYLIPDLLSKQECFFEWDDESALNFEYHYNVLPTSIFSRFVVRQHHRLCDKILWRTGIMLIYDNDRALIKVDYNDNTIKMSILGTNNPKNFLSNLRFTFDSIHHDLPGIEVEEKVPIPKHPKVVVSYRHLCNLEKHNIDQYFIDGIDEPVFVHKLLNGVESPNNRKFGKIDRYSIREVLNKKCNEEYLLRELCFELNVSYGSLTGYNVETKIIDLIHYFERRGQLDILANKIFPNH